MAGGICRRADWALWSLQCVPKPLPPDLPPAKGCMADAECGAEWRCGNCHLYPTCVCVERDRPCHMDSDCPIGLTCMRAGLAGKLNGRASGLCRIPKPPKPPRGCPRTQPKPLSKCPLPLLKPEARSCNYDWRKCCGKDGKVYKIYNTVRMNCLPGVNVVGKWHKVDLESPCARDSCSMWG